VIQYLDVEVAVEALDEHDEGAGEVVPQGRRLDRHAGVLGTGPDQETLRTSNQTVSANNPSQQHPLLRGTHTRLQLWGLQHALRRPVSLDTSCFWVIGP